MKIALGVLAFLAAFLAEFFAEVWSINSSRAVNGKYPLSRKKMSLRVNKAMGWTVLLLALGWVDIGGVLTGLPLYAVIPGSLLGGALGLRVTLWRRWHETARRLAEKKSSPLGTSGPEEPIH